MQSAELDAEVGAQNDAARLSLRVGMSAAREAATRSGAHNFTVGVACSYTPLHLPAFVGAYLGMRRPDFVVTTTTGTYGDLSVALEDLAAERCDATIVLLEWPDLDPRLSLRRAGTAPLAGLTDVVGSARRRLSAIASRVEKLAVDQSVVVVAPTLALPPYFSARATEQGAAESALRELIAGFTSEVARHDRVRVLDPAAVADVDTIARFDPKMHIKADFPYSVDYASLLAQQAVGLLDAPAPKKGVITDLDDTLWRGLVGEVGANGVSWELDSGGQVHAIYQQCLARLSQAGVLIAVVSKNERSVVDEALARADLVVPLDAIFPVRASWQPKSQAVAEVLTMWNIGASDVVMIDDSPLELGEISATHPDITTLHFAKDDPAAVLELVRRLDDMFAKDSRSAEDTLRVASLRSNAHFEQAQSVSAEYDDFLRDVAATISIETGTAHEVPRAFELVNKTNQFNLNGARPTQAEWRARAEREGALSMIVRYADRFGDLGAISILTGYMTQSRLIVDSWVLSCRAFSRAVETHVLSALVEHYAPDVIEFDYVQTAKNMPLRRFLSSAGVDFDSSPVVITADTVRADATGSIHVVNIDSNRFDGASAQ